MIYRKSLNATEMAERKFNIVIAGLVFNEIKINI
jgi:hypothetical protein